MVSFFKIHTQEKSRIIGFDLLRCLAIFFVLRGHAAKILEGTILEGFPWFRTPHGVDIFLVITGFFIGLKFLKSFENKSVLDKKTVVKRFFFNTSFRILPNYYLILLIQYICVQQGFILGNTEQFSILLFLTFTQNLWYAFYGFYWESWSLATQMCFYIFYPIVTFLASLKWKLKYFTLIFSLFIIAFAIIYRWSHQNPDMDYFYWDVWIRKVVISRMDCIFVGVLAAWFKFYHTSFWQKYALSFTGFGLMIYILNSFFIPVDVQTIYTQIFYLSTSALAIALGFPCIERISIKSKKIQKPILVISTLSYAMYLTNLLIIQIMDVQFPNWLINFATLKYALFYIITFIASYLLYILYEKPMYLLGKKLSK